MRNVPFRSLNTFDQFDLMFNVPVRSLIIKGANFGMRSCRTDDVCCLHVIKWPSILCGIIFINCIYLGAAASGTAINAVNWPINIIWIKSPPQASATCAPSTTAAAVIPGRLARRRDLRRCRVCWMRIQKLTLLLFTSSSGWRELRIHPSCWSI